ncbi:MAG: Mur ligase domain-containing protein, partial [Bacteroidales bacterium]
MDLSLKKIAKIVEGDLRGNPAVKIDNIIIDSRKYYSPQDTLFIALRGKNNDGHDYIEDLLAAGISSFIVESIPTDTILQPASFIVVKNTLQALQGLGAWFRKEFKSPVVGITGSNGKTIVKEWIYQALDSNLETVRSPQSYN